MANDYRNLINLLTEATSPIAINGEHKVELVNYRDRYLFDIEMRVRINPCATSSLHIIGGVNVTQISTYVSHSVVRPNDFARNRFTLKKHQGAGDHRVHTTADWAFSINDPVTMATPPRRYTRRCMDVVSLI